MSRTERILGCIAGLAVGDALGYPVEGWTGEKIAGRFGRITDFVEPPLDPPERWRIPGLHSDDTQLALIIAETLIEERRADPDAICQKFLEMAEGPPHLALGAHRGAGRNFRYTIQSLRNGASWNGASQHSAGVGASMRVAPVGLVFGIDDAAVRTNTALQALTTHNDPRAVAASLLVAHVVGRLAWTPPNPFQPELFLTEEIQFVRRSEAWLFETHSRHLARGSRPILNHMSSALAGLTGSIDKAPDAVLPGIAERATELAGYTIEHPCRGFAPAGVVSAFYFFLHFKGDFEKALTEAVNWGGDTDTVGSILGALCGTCHGLEAIPGRWLDALRGRDLVLSHARALAGDRSAIESEPDMAEVELAWTLEEDRTRREKTGQPAVDSSDWVRRGVARVPPERPPRERDDRERDASRSSITGDERRGRPRYPRDRSGYRPRRGDSRRESRRSE